MNDQNKNMILATALSFLVILVWFLLFPPEEPQQQPPAQTTQQTQQGDGPRTATQPQNAEPSTEGDMSPQQAEAARQAALADGERIGIDTPELAGSISLTGGRIDDLSLKSYFVTLESEEIVRLLSPVGGQGAYYALYGWSPGGDLGYSDVPGANTNWQVESGGPLGVDSPVTLVWDNGSGLIFRRTISVDDKFMFTIDQSVENTGDAEQRLAPYGMVARHGEPDTVNFFILHEGVVRMTDGELEEISYSNMPDMDPSPAEGGDVSITRVNENGWVGFTDKNWMTTLAPMPGEGFLSVAKYVPNGMIYQTESRMPTQTVAPGETAQVSTYLFAGAKEWEAIRNYQNDLGIQGFIDSIDWGWFFFLTKPIFWMLHNINEVIGNMGWSIIVLTLLIKAALLPLAWKSYASMAKMKELQPEMEKIKERVGDDRQKMQQEMMALYKTQKVNPAAGCLPILMQIPIFFSLYKVIFVTIELRHAPWFGPFQDLSTPDPTSILNLFGLLPIAAPTPDTLAALIFIGILPLGLGISMWLQQKLNPAPTDPTQAMIFAWMPWVFMFMLGSFASGLVIYWIANNVITFAQQYLIMRTQGYKPDLFGNISASFKRKRKTE